MSDRLFPVSAIRAKQLACPMAMSTPSVLGKPCVADDCMAWVWTGPEYNFAADCPMDDQGRPVAGWERTPEDDPIGDPVAPHCRWRKATGQERRGRCMMIPVEPR